MYLPYLKSLKAHYSGILLGNQSNPTPVNCRIKMPQKGFADLQYPGIGIEYVTFVRNRERVNQRRVVRDNATESIVRPPLEPLDFLFFIHVFSQDNMAMDGLLQQAFMEKTPFYFALNVELFDGTYNCEIYAEEPERVSIEGMDREAHMVYPLKLWGWVDPNPAGTRTKIVTQLNTRYSLSLTDAVVDEEIITLF